MFSNIAGSRAKPPVQIFMVVRRSKKHFAPLHKQDRGLLLLPNTCQEEIFIPSGLKLYRSVDDFKIRTLRAGFQRRPELLMRGDALAHGAGELFYDAMTERSSRKDKTHRIQQELVQKAVSLCCDIRRIKDTVSTKQDILEKYCSSPVLDIGCGNGHSTLTLLEMGFSCVGVDVHFESLLQFQRRHQRMRKVYQSGGNCFSTLDIDCEQDQCDPFSANWDENVDNFDGGAHVDTDKLRTGGHLHVMKQCQHEGNVSFSQGFDLVHSSKVIPNYSPQFTDMVRWDLRYGLPFKANSFDTAISISFLQWLFYGERQKQLHMFFSSLKSVLRPSGRAVIQFYPRSANQLKDTICYATRFFQGVVVGDYPHIDRGRKLFLVLLN